MKLALLAVSLFTLWLLIVWHLSSPTAPHRVGKPVGAVGAITEPRPHPRLVTVCGECARGSSSQGGAA